MASSLAGITASVVGYALDGLSLRHDAIASNIANINTAGYRPVEVRFEQKIVDILANKDKAFASYESFNSLLPPHISYIPSLGGQSTNPSLDMSTVMLNQNVVQYEALIKGLEKYTAPIAAAINEGRR
jgi:flagellar basal-body rod protein FlgB